MNYCTLFDREYMTKGLCLLRSMEKHVEDYHLFILALDDEVWTHFVVNKYKNVTVARLESIESGALLEAKASRTHQEFCWLLASQWTLRCILQHQLENVTYIDADSFFFSSPKLVFDEMGDAPVAIPPHRFAEKDLERLQCNGIFNVNHVYFTRAGLPCLREWADYALQHCYNSPNDFADQACFDWLIPKYSGHAIENIGLNVAPWNSFQYSFTESNGKVYVNGVEVILVHMHEFLWNDGNPRLTNWQVNDDARQLIYEPYIALYREIERA